MNYGKLTAGTTKTAIDTAKPSEKGEIITYLSRMGDVLVDALIGNWDRHNGNWGFLYHVDTDRMELAPVYDCGSCLFPQADESIMRGTLADPNELNLRIFNIPLSGIRLNNKKINYFDFISSLEYPDCNAALRYIVPKIDMTKIDRIIDETPFISELQKDFYKTVLAARKERILDYSLEKLEKNQAGNHL